MNAEKTERLLREMRERAILMESTPGLEISPGDRKTLRSARQEYQNQLEQLKKLYFNAGRWAGGARDWTAREAFQRVGKKEWNNDRT